MPSYEKYPQAIYVQSDMYWNRQYTVHWAWTAKYRIMMLFFFQTRELHDASGRLPPMQFFGTGWHIRYDCSAFSSDPNGSDCNRMLLLLGRYSSISPMLVNTILLSGISIACSLTGSCQDAHGSDFEGKLQHDHKTSNGMYQEPVRGLSPGGGYFFDHTNSLKDERQSRQFQEAEFSVKC